MERTQNFTHLLTVSLQHNSDKICVCVSYEIMEIKISHADKVRGSRHDDAIKIMFPISETDLYFHVSTLSLSSPPPPLSLSTRYAEDPVSPRTASIPLTGDESADKDIIAFYRSRQKLIDRTAKKQ